MKTALLSLLFVLVTSVAGADLGLQSRVTIQPKSLEVFNAGPIHYVFQLFETTSKKSVLETDLVETHTKILHLIANDSSRHEFNHAQVAPNGN